MTWLTPDGWKNLPTEKIWPRTLLTENFQCTCIKRKQKLFVWLNKMAGTLSLSWRRPLSYRNQSINLRSKSMYWFLYDNGLHHERVKGIVGRGVWFPPLHIWSAPFWHRHIFWNFAKPPVNYYFKVNSGFPLGWGSQGKSGNRGSGKVKEIRYFLEKVREHSWKKIFIHIHFFNFKKIICT